MQYGYLRFLLLPEPVRKVDGCGSHYSKLVETVGVNGAHVIAAKTRKLLITERRRRQSKRNAKRVCRCRATTNTRMHSDRTGTEAVAAATATTTTVNREVGRRAAVVSMH